MITMVNAKAAHGTKNFYFLIKSTA